MDATKEIHYRYILSYLLAAIVLLVALAYFNVPNLVDKFSFALTLSSLLLAILAIFYTIIAAQKQDIQFSRLAETNANIEYASKEMISAAADIRVFAKEAPSHFQNIGLKLDNINNSFGTIKSSSPPSGADKQVNDVQETKIDRAQFQQMFYRLHFGSMASLYLFTCCITKNKTIEEEAFQKLEFTTFEHVVGVLNGLEAAGLLTLKIHKRAIVPATCLPVVLEDIKDLLHKVIKVIDKSNADFLTRCMTAIENFAEGKL